MELPVPVSPLAERCGPSAPQPGRVHPIRPPAGRCGPRQPPAEPCGPLEPVMRRNWAWRTAGSPRGEPGADKTPAHSVSAEIRVPLAQPESLSGKLQGWRDPASGRKAVSPPVWSSDGLGPVGGQSRRPQSPLLASWLQSCKSCLCLLTCLFSRTINKPASKS